MTDTLNIIIPNSVIKQNEKIEIFTFEALTENNGIKLEHQNIIDKCSSFKKVIEIYKNILIFINKLKERVQIKNEKKFSHIQVNSEDHNYFDQANKLIILREQQIFF